MSQAVKRACDACHRRKVKCDGINPCRNCSSAQLSCTFNAIPQKKGPKGSRAKVISELRETQRQTSLSAKVQNRMNGIPCAPPSPSLTPTPGLLTSDLVKECATFFFDHMNSQAPILDQRAVEQQVLYMEQNRDAYCLMASMCAFCMLQPGMTMPANDPYNLDMVPGANIISSQLLLEETLRVRKGYEYLDMITLNALATNFFIFGCYYGQEMHDKAWYYLREATTMIHMAGMNKEEYYMQFEPSEAARRRRLYWLFFVIERAYAIQRQRPLTLQATINLPTLSDDPADPLAHQLDGFILLVNLFRHFDDAFMATWNKTRGHLSPQYVSNLQKQLNELTQSYLCQDSSYDDLHLNQQWLKNTVWQLNNGVVNSPEQESFQYPMAISRELLMNMASQFPGQGMELLNSGLLEKLIETAYSLTDYLAMQPPSRDPFAMGPREHLTHIITVVAASRTGDYRFLPLLMSKVSDVLPRLANPMLQNAPENPVMASVDIFDGFGNAGMAQPPQLSMMEEDHDRKFSVDEYEKRYAMDMSRSTPDSASICTGSISPSDKIKGAFVTSPSIMSPTVDYPHDVNGYGCAPMPEMVMSPLGPHPSHGPHQHHRHMSRQSISHGHDALGPHITPMGPQSMSHIMQPAAHHMSAMGGGRGHQRQDSFTMPGHAPLRAVGDFHSMARDASMVGMSPITGEMNFAALR
ncbi:putative sucrose utilization protein SUC1 [Escovopsis weberi]|uniref:Putative sucrose utilization protein SUC1 n=1 Tax=Escovopsis weberi TaxID=150374 RepID=A0A0N0RU51_ESCWE|nr:putative sucrose utilization protein SUC1 [Escovopsis weberi]